MTRNPAILHRRLIKKGKTDTGLKSSNCQERREYTSFAVRDSGV